ncbi:hypothetical protein D8S78_16875 [Natrialba swarupiae]|nr:hypothetical protein [Natrialba swarupiae]
MATFARSAPVESDAGSTPSPDGVALERPFDPRDRTRRLATAPIRAVHRVWGRTGAVQIQRPTNSNRSTRDQSNAGIVTAIARRFGIAVGKRRLREV